MMAQIFYRVVKEQGLTGEDASCTYGIDAFGIDDQGRAVAAYIDHISQNKECVEDLAEEMNRGKYGIARFAHMAAEMKQKNLRLTAAPV